MNFADDADKPFLFLGPKCIRANYEYRGEFLLAKDKQHFGPKGYEKLARDLIDTLEHEMVKIEFEQFKPYILGIKKP